MGKKAYTQFRNSGLSLAEHCWYWEVKSSIFYFNVVLHARKKPYLPCFYSSAQHNGQLFQIEVPHKLLQILCTHHLVSFQDAQTDDV